jgi:hypothetical protein
VTNDTRVSVATRSQSSYDHTANIVEVRPAIGSALEVVQAAFPKEVWLCAITLNAFYPLSDVLSLPAEHVEKALMIVSRAPGMFSWETVLSLVESDVDLDLAKSFIDSK